MAGRPRKIKPEEQKEQKIYKQSDIDDEAPKKINNQPIIDEGVILLSPCHSCSVNGVNYSADENGFIVVPEEAVKPLLDHGFKRV